MKASELRIGNLTDKGFIENLLESGIHVGKGKCFNYSEVEPIPLNEEWLVKFGFEKSTVWFRKGVHAVNPLLANLYEFKNIPVKEIEFTHQLQNLYFALTGNELTLTK